MDKENLNNIEETQSEGQEKKPWLTLEDLEREIELPTDSIYSDSEEPEEEEEEQEEEFYPEEENEEPEEEEIPEEEPEEKKKSIKKGSSSLHKESVFDNSVERIQTRENQIKKDNVIKEQQIKNDTVLREQQIIEEQRLREASNIIDANSFNDSSIFDGIYTESPHTEQSFTEEQTSKNNSLESQINVQENLFQDSVQDSISTENQKNQEYRQTENISGNYWNSDIDTSLSNDIPGVPIQDNINYQNSETYKESTTRDSYKDSNLYKNPSEFNYENAPKSHIAEGFDNRNDLSDRVNRNISAQEVIASGIIKNENVSSYKESTVFRNPEIVNTYNTPRATFSEVLYNKNPLKDRLSEVPSYKSNIANVSVNDLHMIPNGPVTADYSVDKPFHKRAIDTGISASSVSANETTNYGAARVLKNDLQPGFSSNNSAYQTKTETSNVSHIDRPPVNKTQMEVVLKQASIKKADMSAGYASSIKTLQEYNNLENKASSPHRFHSFENVKSKVPEGSSLSGGAAKDREENQKNVSEEQGSSKSGKAAQSNPVSSSKISGPSSSQESPNYNTGDRKYRSFYNKTTYRSLDRFKGAIANGAISLKDGVVAQAKQISVEQDEDYRKTREVLSYSEIPYEMIAAIGARASYKDLLNADMKANAFAQFANKYNLPTSGITKEQVEYLKNVTSGTNRKVFDKNEFNKLGIDGKAITKRQQKLLDQVDKKLSLQNIMKNTKGMSEDSLKKLNSDIFLSNSSKALKAQTQVFNDYFQKNSDRYLRSLGITTNTDIRKLKKFLKDKNLTGEQLKAIEGLINHKKLLTAKGNISGRVTKTLKSIKRKITGFLKKQNDAAMEGAFKVYDLGKTAVKITRFAVKGGRGAILLGVKIEKGAYQVGKFMGRKAVDAYGKLTGKTTAIQAKRQAQEAKKTLKKATKELKKQLRAEKINKITNKIGNKVGNTKVGKAGKKIGNAGKKVGKGVSNAGRIVSKPFKAAGNLYNSTLGKLFRGLGKIFGFVSMLITVILIILVVIIGLLLIFVMIYGNFIHAGSNAMIKVIDKEDVKSLKSIVDSLDLEEELKLDEFVKGKPKLPDVLGNEIDRYGCPDDDYETGYTVKYFNGSGEEVYEISNLKDILSMVTVMVDQNFKDEDAIRTLILDLYEMSHKDEFFTFEESDIYFCSEGCKEITYKCYEVVNDAAIPYNTYGTREFNTYGCEPYYTYCEGCEEVEEEEEPVEESETETEEEEEPEYTCPGHINPGCPGTHVQPVCYGHRNVDIEITIWFMEDMMKEEMPSNPVYDKYLKEFYEKGGWACEDHVQWAEALYEEDWYELYGINIGAAYSDSDLVSLDELTPEELEELIGSMTGDRAAVLEWAGMAVGKIPYYWYWRDFGSVNAGFEGNEFGSSTRKGREVFPDTMGRTRYGLDCSGFVCWAFKSAGCNISEYGTTATLWGLSRSCTKDELEPGDLGFKANPANLSGVNHVGIYAGDGQWIHCTGSPINMTVKETYNGFKYYRKVFD